MSSNPPYEYYGLMAETWDLIRGDTSGWQDRAFFLEAVARFGQPVLDVGCGTGRLVLDFVAQGIDCDGVDNSPDMLAVARRKAGQPGVAARLHQQSVVEMVLPRQYQTVLVPSSSFQLLVDAGDARRAMNRLHDHLRPGGALVMPFMRLWQPGESLEKEWAMTGETLRPEDGATVRRWSRSWFEPDTGLEHTEDRYDVVVDGVVVQSEAHRQSPATRDYAPEEVRGLYATAGLEDVRLYRAFTWQPAEAEDRLFVAIGRR